ncbi:hypothetical protein [Streptomyces luteireticuli]|uniref:hypothetical protein n=1 Tax=Streptomyces luteireticuli TaxID=173858 RepID=UPI0035580757
MSQRRRTTAVCLLLLLMAVFAPGLAATVTSSSVSPAPAAKPLGDHRPVSTYAVPHADARDSGGGSCRPLDVPLKGADAVVVHGGHIDPLTAAGTARSPLPRAPHQRLGVPRAPPATVAGAAELLPVLRI